MTDETNQPAAPVDPTADAAGASGQPTPSVEPDSAPAQEDHQESDPTGGRMAHLEQENLRLTRNNAALQMALDKATGVHEPEPFPCAVYRGSETTQANGPNELLNLLSHGWREKPR